MKSHLDRMGIWNEVQYHRCSVARDVCASTYDLHPHLENVQGTVLEVGPCVTAIADRFIKLLLLLLLQMITEKLMLSLFTLPINIIIIIIIIMYHTLIQSVVTATAVTKLQSWTQEVIMAGICNLFRVPAIARLLFTKDTVGCLTSTS